MNKSQLARHLGVVTNTISEWVNREPDFPVLSRGNQTSDWQFDVKAVEAYRAEQAAERERQRAERAAQARLPLPAVHSQSALWNPKDRLFQLQVQTLERRNAEAARLLVPVAEVADAVSSALARISRDAHAFLRQLGREHDWPASYVSEVEKQFAATQRATVGDLMKVLGNESGSDAQPEPPAGHAGR